jgi:GNAT superfamily N-acetyltransferase
VANVVVRRELLAGLGRLNATTVLQRARLTDPLNGMWEAADVQWWWRRPRDTDGRVAGYALFWFDLTTLVGLLEPMRVEDDYQRRPLARMLLTNGLDRLAHKGARRLKVGFETDAARNLYLGADFVQTSVDRLLIRPSPHGSSPKSKDSCGRAIES